MTPTTADSTLAPGTLPNRSFGLLLAFFSLATATAPCLTHQAMRSWALVPAGFLLLLSLLAPAALSPFTRAWLSFAAALHKITSPIALAVLYFLVLSPMGLLMRLVKKRPLDLALDPEASTYWQEVDASVPENMSKQY